MAALDPLSVGAAIGLLALVLARAALHKVGDFDGFRQTLLGYRLLPERLGGLAAVGLATAEVAAALLLVVPGLVGLGSVAAALLLLLYAGAMAINLLRGRSEIDCGCGGPAQGISWLLVGRNLLLVGVAVIAGAPVAARPLGVFDLVLLPTLVAAAWLLLMVGERLAETHAHIRAVEAGRSGLGGRRA